MSAVVAYKTNNDHIQNVVQMKQKGNATFLGVDVWGISKAYFNAWSESPALMTGATVLDAATGYGLYSLGVSEGKDSTTPAVTSQTLPSTIRADNVIIGDGNTIHQENE
jgi:hypothetical protein